MTTLKGGKTAPRLLADLSSYNPDKLPASGYNLFAELAYPFEHDGPHRRTTGKWSCQHRWVPKLQQTSPNLGSSYADTLNTAAAFCTECCCHVRLSIDTGRSTREGGLCPNNSNPLHHFQYQPDLSSGFIRSDEDKWTDGRTFECTSPSCRAMLRSLMYSPHLTKEYVALLTDKNLISARAQAAMDAEPARFEGHAIPSSLTVMGNLKAYIVNSLETEPRRIKDTNKKWTLCFGSSCIGLMEFLGFAKEGDDWMPPRPDLRDQRPYMNKLNIQLDDVACELDTLMNQQSVEEKRATKIFVELKPDPNWARKLLACDDYSKTLASRTAGSSVGDEHPYYAGLGAVVDFHDTLIQFAYEQQIVCDPANSSYYLESLNGIADGRKSEDLKTKAAIEASTGKLSNTEIRDAYGSFNLDIHNTRLDDEHIIGVFQSRAADAPLHEAELRRNLTIIGRHRQSQRIEEFAANSVTTYEQALSWLGASAEMDDSFIVAMFGVKVNENPAHEEVARNCVKMIAARRKSRALFIWLDTGELGDIDMNVEHAYSLLELPDKSIPDDSIIPSFLVLVSDNPSKKPSYEKALRAIAEERNSDFLRAHLGDMDPGAEQRLADWPVGLSNIGNTCYLNSLLQYFFSIKPVRDLVLDFENYKEDLNDNSIVQKEVGGRKITRTEARRAQEFTNELRQLFEKMISSTDKTVTPRKELARLTILSSQSEADVKTRRESVSFGRKPMSQAEAMAQVSSNTATSPTHPTSANTLDAIADVDAMEEDKSSEGTLVDKISDISTSNEIIKQADAFERKENLPPTIEEIPRPRSPEKKLQPLGNASPSRVNEQPVNEPIKVESPSAIEKAPSRPPPPVPPRSGATNKTDDILVEVEFEATQRDVTEVIDNVFFQLQCAIKPNIASTGGQQTDTIKQLFYGRSRETYDSDKVENTEAVFQDIKIQLPDGPRHIYEALDAVFDEHHVRLGSSVEARHSTILSLPPILQIFVSRGQFDKDKGRASKSLHHLALDKTIYMDRYLETEDDDLSQRRASSWKWKRELRDLQVRDKYLQQTDVGLTMAESLEATATYLLDFHDEDEEEVAKRKDMATRVGDAAVRTRHEQQDIAMRIAKLHTQIASQFVDFKKHAYNLFAVFIHVGGINSGHYWIYIHDFKKQIWRKYNDGYVTEVKEDEVFAAGDPNRPATSTFVVYVKAGTEENLTQVICRDVKEEPSTEGSEGLQTLRDASGDTVMGN